MFNSNNLKSKDPIKHDGLENIVEDLMRIEQRIDSVITFALINFVHRIARTVLQEDELVLVSGSSLVLLHFAPSSTHLSSIVTMMQKIIVMVFSQSVINVISQNDALLHLHSPHYSILLRAFTITTCLLVLMSLLCYAFRTVDAVQRSMTLLLYIYADATEFIIAQLKLGGLLGALLSIWVYLVSHIYRQRTVVSFSILYIFRALNMVCINIVLQSIIDVQATYVGTEHQAAVLILVLFLLDALSVVMPALNESRDYAVWKSSQKIFIIVDALNVGTDTLLFVCLFVLSTKPMWHSLLTSVYELALLVIINVLLKLASEYIDQAYSIDKAILLFIYIIIIHESSGLVFSTRKQ
jgi:hypothetical protein